MISCALLLACPATQRVALPVAPPTADVSAAMLPLRSTATEEWTSSHADFRCSAADGVLFVRPLDGRGRYELPASFSCSGPSGSVTIRPYFVGPPPPPYWADDGTYVQPLPSTSPTAEFTLIVRSASVVSAAMVPPTSTAECKVDGDGIRVSIRAHGASALRCAVVTSTGEQQVVDIATPRYR